MCRLPVVPGTLKYIWSGDQKSRTIDESIIRSRLMGGKRCGVGGNPSREAIGKIARKGIRTKLS